MFAFLVMPDLTVNQHTFTDAINFHRNTIVKCHSVWYDFICTKSVITYNEWKRQLRGSSPFKDVNEGLSAEIGFIR